MTVIFPISAHDRSLLRVSKSLPAFGAVIEEEQEDVREREGKNIHQFIHALHIQNPVIFLYHDNHHHHHHNSSRHAIIPSSVLFHFLTFSLSTSFFLGQIWLFDSVLVYNQLQLLLNWSALFFSSIRRSSRATLLFSPSRILGGTFSL